MNIMHPMSKKSLKPIQAYLENHFGITLPLHSMWCKDEKLYHFDGDAELLPEKRLNSLGLYIGEWRHNEFRFSIEGAQRYGPAATKHVLNLSVENLQEWCEGKSIPSTDTGFVLLRYDKAYIGCGKAKEGLILNFMPKSRRCTVH